ncbi:MAG: ribulose-bisphosphate carboxylase large subunit, partial [Candidatus Aenigmarchaeota archaeon]|nr:ribulose-bisphosphate carboxylase large subunit [Candidatus Aenigmarchaeota archaeon]
MYINYGYKPKNDIVCTFYLEPAKKEVMAGIAAESSIGTWTDVPKTKRRLAAKVYHWKKKGSGVMVKIAYPADLFEHGNVPQLLSSVAGNIFGMKKVRNLRLEDIEFPKSYLSSFKGPKFGIDEIRRKLKIKNRPVVGTIVKPKLGLSSEEHAEAAYEAWVGGLDIVKEDENLTSQKFNIFEKRVILTMKAKKKAEKETGEKKVYLPNVTAETNEMLKRISFVENHGGNYIMLDMFTIGFSALQTVRNETQLPIHAHRAMHAAMTKGKNGVSML